MKPIAPFAIPIRAEPQGVIQRFLHLPQTAFWQESLDQFAFATHQECREILEPLARREPPGWSEANPPAQQSRRRKYSICHAG